MQPPVRQTGGWSCWGNKAAGLRESLVFLVIMPELISSCCLDTESCSLSFGISAIGLEAEDALRLETQQAASALVAFAWLALPCLSPSGT